MNRDLVSSALARIETQPDYTAYQALANALEQANPDARTPPLRVAVLRNFTFEPVLPVLQGEIARAGFYPEIYLGDFDAIAADALDGGSPLYSFRPDFIIVAQWLETLSPALATRFTSLSAADVEREVDRIVAATVEIITGIRRHSLAPVLVNNFPLPFRRTLGILDAQSANYHTHTVLRLNAALLEQLQAFRDAYVVDYMSLMASLGTAAGFDERYWHMAGAPLGRAALLAFGQEYAKFIRPLRGKSRKCLVLDCDNTLWGGVIGEDGMSGIRLGAEFPGSCYQALQREILNLHDRGVILALCSKNNEADAIEVLRQHPEMILREQHFAAMRINWQDKVTNLTSLAEELNVGLDAFVFVDDSQFECDFVRERLPQVAVLQLSSAPATFAARLSAPGYFDSLSFSAEDRNRTPMYRDESERRELLRSAGSLPEYLRGLGLVAEIGIAGESVIARVSQLTQKTNQFNLTTRRYGGGQIRAFVAATAADVFYVRLRDRLSDLGIIGVGILVFRGADAEIDTFLLSCRALGRGAEDAFLAHMAAAAHARGCRRLVGRYLPTSKNAQVADFYSRHGFTAIEKNEGASAWELMLDAGLPECPDWMEIRLVQEEAHSAGQ